MKHKIYDIIFETDTPAGRAFDICLIFLILLSVVLVILESIPEYRLAYGTYLYYAEWILTGLFLCEYFLRIYSLKKPISYIFSFFGVVDFFSSFATVFSLLIPGAQSFLIIRSFRLLRIFRILKLARYFDESQVIMNALIASKIKISVFLFTVMILVLLSGTAMYIIEGPTAVFTNIPISMYWAVVTLTTVGYGDIAPATNLGKLLASFLMIAGYAIIAVPTGIVTSELTKVKLGPTTDRACPGCGTQSNLPGSNFCRVCGINISSFSPVYLKTDTQKEKG